MIESIHLAATAGFCTLLWLVQVVVYPQMARVRAEDFAAYHARHTRAITWIVAPLFFAEGLGAAALCWVGWGVAPVVHGISVGLFAANSLVTFLWFVPVHLRLQVSGHDPVLLARLARMNGWRTVLSSARLIWVLVWLST
jgi:hypothetical protein